MSAKIIDTVNDKRWIEFISGINESTIFHHPCWLSILKKQYKFEVFSYCLVDNGNILAGIPFCNIKNDRWISLPFSDYCNLLYLEKIYIDELINKLFEEEKKLKYNSLEIRFGYISHKNISSSSDSVLHTLSLSDDIDSIFKNFKETQVQQPIKNALKNNLTYKVSNSLESLEDFYKLHLRTRKKLGVPIQPKGFFRNIFTEIIKKGFGYIVLVYKENIPISSGLFAGYNNVLSYKFGASDFRYLKLRPNNLMLWIAIQEAVKRGYKVFDFGKTDNDNVGLRKFKSGWGAEEVALYYSYYPSIPEKGKFNFVKDKLVAPVIKYSPSAVCRLTGEILYKHFA
ncbi:MAG: peptidoglycan bridge formation glycyltransferase FemA/FemB family protein [Ignavibacteriae bacterium]|nr:peptidoglycan bridge formation glycyltransferase FemA/FemB family protein [Ignavibacteriota bacterium]